MSSPEKRIVPLSGRSMPESWPMSVVLPAPLGPMMAWVSPSLTARSTWSVARSAPKLLHSWRTSSRPLLMPSPEQAGEAALGEDDDEDEDDAEVELPVVAHPVLGQELRALQPVLQQQQRRGAEQRPRGRGDAAEDHHEHELARARPAHEI